MQKKKERLKAYLRTHLIAYRHKKGMTQAQMSVLLHISERSYSNLECGKYCFSTVTLVCFLGLLSDKERLEIICGFKALAADREEQEVA